MLHKRFMRPEKPMCRRMVSMMMIMIYDTSFNVYLKLSFQETFFLKSYLRSLKSKKLPINRIPILMLEEVF